MQAQRVRNHKVGAMRGGSEGPNWILLAGGAAVTALSYVIGRRQKHGFEDVGDVREGKSGKFGLANHNDIFEPEHDDLASSKTYSHQESFGSVTSNELDDSTRSGLPTSPARVHGTSTRGLCDAFQASNHLDRRHSQNISQDDPTVEFSKEVLSEEERDFQRRISIAQEDMRRSYQQGVLIGRSANRNMVHRLRKQLRSRDEMILSMQNQISEYDRSLSQSDAHMSVLQARLVESSKVISDFYTEVHLLRAHLADLFQFGGRIEDYNQLVTEGAEQIANYGDEHSDLNSTLLELKMFREDLDRLKEETTAKESARQALSQGYKALLEKVDRLECALKEQGMLVSEKENELDINRMELARVNSKLQDIHHRLQAQVEEMEALRHCNAKLEACIHKFNLRRFSPRGIRSSEEITSSTSTEVSDSSSHPREGGEDLELSDLCSEVELDFTEDYNYTAVSDSMVVTLQQEVEQLSTAVSSQSKVVTEQKELTTNLVEDLQVNEVSMKLTDTVKSEQVDKEMADIKKYQAKIEELGQKVSNLSRDSTDEVGTEQSLHVAALLRGLAEKLAAQEEQAKQTAVGVEQLSTSLQQLNPSPTKSEEVEMPLEGEPDLKDVHSNDVGNIKNNSSSAHVKYADEDSNVIISSNNANDTHVEYQALESRPVPTEVENTGHITWDVQQKYRYFPYEVEQVMAANTPDNETVEFLPILEEFSPLVRQARSPRLGTGSSRRYLFNSGTTDESGQANSLEASSGYLVTTAESPLGVQSSTESPLLIDRSDAASTSPVSQMLSQLDFKSEFPETSSLQEASVEVLLPDSPKEMVEDEEGLFEEVYTPRAARSIESEANNSSEEETIGAAPIDESETNTPSADGIMEAEHVDDSISESGSESRGSIDAEFDEILDGTLEDLVKIFSTSVTPSGTPTSSVLSQNSGSKRFQNF
ncbi:uncharacterized protein [Physcomitrium patens]|uniref:Uncharacterized protein n=2 Tax=Physcomitrium patens TaxID=3218 RepID=A0A2K1IGZ4_PHYPA|nr:uncharacterized protein LOC112276586 isoform X1 [Physcomitrium patens]XP_024363772.1 uncharacterized protein LOC112276586 isoform X1 [Physcomitrium patens]PNR28545.1 hypothetical protein PHYPA_029137 [Physcomitrium patens]|eukprot:XP_024363771.1 uncharacterized protein LOC112276586 isoform X1 [Physcomitrella patens]